MEFNKFDEEKHMQELVQRSLIIQEIVKKFILKRCIGNCLCSSAMMVHKLGKGEVCEGYLVFDEYQSYIRHYWVRIDMHDYDVGSIINFYLLPIAAILRGKTRLTDIPPDGYENKSIVDETEQLKLKELEKSYCLYVAKPKQYWKRAPGWMRHV